MIKNAEVLLSSESIRYRSRYRWVVLALTSFTTMFVVAMPGMALSVLFNEIQQSLGISLLQVGIIWSVASFTGLLMALPTGILSDHLGTRQMIIWGVLFSGLFGLSRGFVNSYSLFLLTNVLHGLVTTTIVLNLIKLISIWFAPDQRGTALGVLSSGFAIGFLAGSYVSATILAPLLGGWQNVFILFGAIAVLLGILWLALHPGDPSSDPLNESRSVNEIFGSVGRDLLALLRLPQIWLLGLSKLLFWAGVRGFTGYLPLYLRGQGWDPATADSALSIFFLFSLLGAIPLSSLSDRANRRWPFLLAGTLLMGIAILSIGFTDGWVVFVVVALGGFVFDMYMGLSVGMVTEFKAVRAAVAGSAVGLILIFTETGGVLGPIIGNGLERFGPEAPFYFWGILPLVGVGVLFLLREDR